MANTELTVYIALCSILLMSFGAPKVEGCSCEGAHPQQHFCRASYVIGANILKREYVRKNPTGLGSSTRLLGADHEAIEPLNERTDLLGADHQAIEPLGKKTGLLGADQAAIEPLGERTRPYPLGQGLHRLPDEKIDDGGIHYQELEPIPYGEDGLQPPSLPIEGLIPPPDGLQPYPQPGGLQPLQQPAGLQPLPLEGGPEAQGQLEGLLPLPHPEGLQPFPEELQPLEELPPLPLPDDLKPLEDIMTTMMTPATQNGSTHTPEAITASPAKEKPSNDTFLVEPTLAAVEPTTQELKINPESMEAWNYKIIYTVKLNHIYKTGIEEEGWKLGDEVQIESSASTSLCGRTDLKTGKNYLIAGGMPNRVVLCDWIQEHHRLTTRQKQGLKSVYGKSCDVCQIHSCTSRRHCKKPKANRATTCLYDASQHRIGASYSPYDCLASHSRCTLRRGHKCKWQKNNDYHDCVKHQLP